MVMEPDVLALTLDEAMAACAKAHIDVNVVITRSSRQFIPGDARVVRFVMLNEVNMVLTVACEQKGEGGVI